MTKNKRTDEPQTEAQLALAGGRFSTGYGLIGLLVAFECRLFENNK